MHHLRKLALAALAAGAVLALASAGSATATTLCSVNANPCSAVWPSGTTLSLALKSNTNWVATTSGGSLNPTLTCAQSTGGLFITSAGGGSGVPVSASLTSLTYSSCSSVNPSGCSATWTVNGLPTSMSVDWATGTTGTVSLTMPIIEHTCTFFGFPITCQYGGNAITGTLAGGNPATLTFTSQTLHGAGGGMGFVCPTAMSMSATYNTTLPRSRLGREFVAGGEQLAQRLLRSLNKSSTGAGGQRPLAPAWVVCAV